MNEIYLALFERRNAPLTLKRCFMGVLQRFCADPRALVETFLNYGCDRNVVDNMFQTLVEDLSKASRKAVMITPFHQHQYEERAARDSGSGWQIRGTMPPPLVTTSLVHHNSNGTDEVPKCYIIKRKALDCLVETLRSLVNWSQQGIADVTTGLETDGRASEYFREAIGPRNLPHQELSWRALLSSGANPNTGLLVW